MASQTGAGSGAVAPASEGEGGGTPVADRIRERIRKARGRFRANDNIAAYIACSGDRVRLSQQTPGPRRCDTPQHFNKIIVESHVQHLKRDN